MRQSQLTPAGLPLLTDRCLLEMAAEYREALTMLAPGNTPWRARVRAQIEEALVAIETELASRGLVHALFHRGEEYLHASMAAQQRIIVEHFLQMGYPMN